MYYTYMGYANISIKMINPLYYKIAMLYPIKHVLLTTKKMMLTGKTRGPNWPHGEELHLECYVSCFISSRVNEEQKNLLKLNFIIFVT